MPNYLLSYHGGHLADTPEGIAEVMTSFGQWFQDLGPALVDRGNPIGRISTVVGNEGVRDGGGPNPVTGYSVIAADTMEAALELVKGCPIVLAGRSVEVGEAFDPMASH